MVRTNEPTWDTANPKEEIFLPDDKLIELTLALQDAKLYKDSLPPFPHQKTHLPERRIVLLGKTGAGKSATGNTILGEKKFVSKQASSSVTEMSMAHQSCVAAKLVSVVDTPGLFDTSLCTEQLSVELARSIYEASPGPHAFLIVLPLNVRYTNQEEDVIQLITEIYGKEALKYTIILFTHGDLLERNMEELIKENKALDHLVQQCGGRYHILNNKDLTNRDQVTTLLEKVDKMVEENGGGFYTSDMFKDAERHKKESEIKRKYEEDLKRLEEIKRIERDTERRAQEAANEAIKKQKSDLEREIEKLKNELQTKTKGNSDSGFLAFLKKHWKKLIAGALIGGAVVAITAATLGVGTAAILAAGAAGAVAGATVGVFAGIHQAGAGAAGAANSGAGAFAGAAARTGAGAFAGATSTGALAGAAARTGAGAFAGATSTGALAFALAGVRLEKH